MEIQNKKHSFYRTLFTGLLFSPLNLIREYLVEKGYAVDTAFTGAEAVTLLHTRTYDCILLDVLLPDFNGFAICEAARRKINPPSSFLAAWTVRTTGSGGLLSGDDYI